MIKNIKRLIDARNKCNEAKIGDIIICPSCLTKHVKKSYQSVFCKSKALFVKTIIGIMLTLKREIILLEYHQQIKDIIIM